MELLWVFVIGALAGIIHQLIDRAKKNTEEAVIRGIVVGMIGGYLTYLGTAALDDISIAVTVFAGGYFGDSVILNVWERMVNRMNLSGQQKEELKEAVKEVLDDD